MTPDQLIAAGIRLYGRKHWKARLAEALAVDVSTVHRICKRAEVPGPVEVAVKGLLQNKTAQERLEREARRLGLMPKKPRKKVLIPYAGAPRQKPRRPRQEQA